jgi:hypothetical protein
LTFISATGLTTYRTSAAALAGDSNKPATQIAGVTIQAAANRSKFAVAKARDAPLEPDELRIICVSPFADTVWLDLF